MVHKITFEMMAGQVVPHAAPQIGGARRSGRTFEKALGPYLVVAALIFSALATSAMVSTNPALAVPVAVFTLFTIILGFASSETRDATRPVKSCAAGVRFVQAPTLPMLGFLWGVAIVAIAVLVR